MSIFSSLLACCDGTSHPTRHPKTGPFTRFGKAGPALRIFTWQTFCVLLLLAISIALMSAAVRGRSLRARADRAQRTLRQMSRARANS